jgi:DNA-binding MarR family transcriptional regulator
MPPPSRQRSPTAAVRALIAVAPLAARWIERLLAAHDPPLTTAQYLALRAVACGQGSVSELARRAGVSGPATSQLLAGLAEAGLVDRRQAADNRRRQELALSSAGARALRSADALLTERLGGLLDDLPRPETDALARALPTVEAALAGTAPPRRPPPPPPPPSRGPRPPRRRP